MSPVIYAFLVREVSELPTVYVYFFDFYMFIWLFILDATVYTCV